MVKLNKTAVVTGASSGMGHATAIKLHQSGYTVFAGARRLAKMQDLADQGIHVMSLDVTDADSTQAFIGQVLATTNRIDVLVNSAGYGSFGAIEDVPTAEAERQFAVNVFGTMHITQLVLPTMRAQHFGKVVNISSTGGQLYSPLGGWYYASKHALEALSDSLRMEVRKFGIDVIIIEPGGTNTEWSAVMARNLRKATPQNSAYRALAERFAQGVSGHFATAEDIANLILRAINARHPKTRYQPRLTEKIMVIAARKLSYRQLDRMVVRSVNSLMKH